jgi:hypothetical protein
MKKAALIFGILFLFLASGAFAFSMRSGYYVGTGLARSITGLGIAPDLVIVNCDTATGRSVWRSKTMDAAGDSTAYFENAVANETGLIRSLDSDGFSIGTNSNVNARNVRYTWSAFSGSGAGGDFYVGSYTGDGTDNRNITGPNFNPAMVWLKRNGASLGVWYSSAMPGDSTQYFSATAPVADCIQGMLGTGFQIGANAIVNQSSDTYYYVAFKATVEASFGMAVGTYTGDNVAGRSIPGVGFAPDRVIVKRAGASNAVLRNTNLYGDETTNFTQAANSTNCLMALEADGFKVGNDARVNTNAAPNTYYYAAFRGVPAATPTGTFKMSSGVYTGNNTSQSITGLGFRPDLVVVKADTNQYAVFSTAMMAPNNTAYLANNSANFADGIVSLDSDGFSVGSNATVNTSPVPYRWTAFAGAPCTNFNIGAYTGIAADNRSITGLGFQPDLVALKRDGGSLGVWRSASMAGDATAYFSATADTTDRLQALEADGFQTGLNAEVNTAGSTNFYFAFKKTPGQFTVEAYTGNGGDDRSIGGTGFRTGYVWVKRPEVTTGAVHRGYNLTGDISQYFTNTANASDLIQALEADGFQVGTNAAVNTNAIVYRYAAWKANSTKLAFTVQPSNTTAGASIAPAIRVEVRDVNNNVDAADNSTSVTLSIKNNPGGGTLTGTATRTVSAGVATFNDIKINKSGTGYTLEATSSGLTSASSNPFNITADTASKLGFTVQPSQVQADAVIAPAVKVAVQDQYGNTITSDNTTSIIMTIKNDPPTGSTLSGTIPRTAASGVATFNDLSIDKTGAGFTLWATTDSYSVATSDAFNVTPADAAKLRIIRQPTSTPAGAAISSVTVEVLDGTNNRVTGDNSTQITFSIGYNPSGGTLEGTLTKTVASGVISFNDLNIKKTGSGYSLEATAGTLTPATTEPFNITPAGANKLAFSIQPSNVMAGAAITPGVKVLVQDANGNTVTTDNSTRVNVSIYYDAGGGLLSGTLINTAAQGEVAFNDLSINKIGAGYVLLPGAAGLSGAASNAFNVTLAPVNKVAFYVQPASTVAGQTITPPVQIAIQDLYGNIISTDNSSEVTVAIGTNPGGGTLTGTATRTASAGIVTFDDLSINKVGNGYTLVAASPGKNPGTSSGFNITPGSPYKLAYAVQPGQTVAGQNISPALKVAIKDFFDNTVSSDNTSQVNVAIQNNPAGGTLAGTTAETAASGEATFSGLNIDKVGTGYTFIGTSAGLNPATSDAFNITPAAPNYLSFLAQPTNTRAGVIITPEVKVAVRDLFGNITTQDNSTLVNIAIRDNPGGGGLFGTKAKTSSAGIAAFDDLRINKKGDGYTFEATAAGLRPATSEPFNITGEAAPPAVVTLYPSRDASNVPAGAAVRITFDYPMDHASVAAAFALKAIMDNNGTSLDAISVSGTTTWDATGQIFSFIPAALSKGYAYRADLAATAQSADEVKVSSAESWQFTVIYDHSRENTTYSTDRRASVRTGSGTLPNDGYILINRDPRNNPTFADPVQITLGINKVLAEGDPFFYPIQSSISEFNLFDSSGTRVATTFAEAAILALYYTDADGDGIVDGTTPPIHARDLVLYRLDEGHGLWVRVPNCSVNLAEHYVYAPVLSFSVYTIMAAPALNVSSAYAFPNPFKPSAGHTAVTFTNLSSQCTIKIFTLSGDLVKTINENSGTGQNTWDVKNESGELLASGTYFFIIKSSSDTKSGKLVVIR